MSELDPALDRLHLCGFEYADEQPNYGPMAVSALDALGHGSLTTGLLDVYVPRLPEFAEGRAIAAEEQPSRIGDFAHAADWMATFEARLARDPWARVLDDALAARCDAPATGSLSPHAVIRLGYAVRNLEQEENPVRLRELAFALAYAFARAGSDAGSQPERVSVLRARDATADDLATRLGEVAVSGAEQYLAHPDQRGALAPGLSTPAAFRVLLPFLAVETARAGLISMLIGLTASLPPKLEGRPSDEAEDLEVARCAQDPSEVRYRAACSVQEHAIVTAESALREVAFTGHSVLRLAAADAALRLSPPGYREWR